jgi:hypothetical protein
MGQFFTEIPAFIIPWIQQQKMFWVSSAPLSPTGHVNLSPKGFDNTFHIVDEKQVWYEDMTGSGKWLASEVVDWSSSCTFQGPKLLRI